MANDRKSSAVHEIANTIIGGLALVVAFYTLWMQVQEKREKHAEVLGYEIGFERANDTQTDTWFKIYNYSEHDIYLETITLKANMSDGLFKLVNLFQPASPLLLHQGEFREFRFRRNFQTPEDDKAEAAPEYANYTQQSIVEAETTKSTILTFDSDLHPYILDRINLALKKTPNNSPELLVLPAFKPQSLLNNKKRSKGVAAGASRP
jgi:hypothetical protein